MEIISKIISIIEYLCYGFTAIIIVLILNALISNWIDERRWKWKEEIERISRKVFDEEFLKLKK